MGESATQLPRFDPETPADAPLELVLGIPDPEEQATIYRYQDIDLGLEGRVRNIFGSSPRMPTNRDARLRTIVNAINEAIPQFFPDEVIPQLFPEKLPDKPAPEARIDIDNYLRGKVTMPGGSQMTRDQLVGFGFIREHLNHGYDGNNGLVETNHPIFQAIRSLSELNEARIKGNEGKPQKVMTLSKAEYDQTADDLLKALLGPDIIDYSEKVIKYWKTVDQEKLDRLRS